jgi:type II restriction/modification system DNA methylase subunit YeeA
MKNKTLDTSKLRKFASFARSALIEQVGTRLKTVLAEKSLARRESPNAVKELEAKIKELGEKRLIETVAYTWFNRFCALRYMDVNRYTRIGVLSPADGQFQPEILAEAKMGHIDDELVPEVTRKQVLRLLDGTDKSADPQGEAYRLLLVAVCNYYHSLMPFMFEKIADYTELLLQDDLLSGTSIPAYTREALLPINCSPEHTEESVEVIGWLYQFYIADKKDEVFEGLKKGKKITSENIPAATQLFTPHWIVRYLVENSLGRLWMLNNPESKLVERMDYYIRPEEPEADFSKIGSPEEIKVCDPACGSGHMLTYAFDLLYEIYREEQYPEPEIPSLILKNNLFGIEIDQRAGALAAFALTMKAREKDKRFFTRKSQHDESTRDLSSIDSPKSEIQNPNVCVLENIQIDPDDLSAYMDKVGRDLFSGGLQGVVNQWEEADNFGSLIRPTVTDVSEVLELLRERQMGQDLFLADVHQKVLKAMRQADYLSPKYHVVVANPPYMGGKGMTPSVKEHAIQHFPEAKGDLFAMFIERSFELLLDRGIAALVTMQSWMFLSSMEKLRKRLLGETTILSLMHMGNNVMGIAFGTAATIWLKSYKPALRGHYCYVQQTDMGENGRPVAFPVRNERLKYVASEEFAKIDGSPIAYWVSENARSAFASFPALGEIAYPCQGMATTNNNLFLRRWTEVSFAKAKFDAESEKDAEESGKKWFPYNKGGEFRKWYGNNEHLVNFENGGKTICDYIDNTPGAKVGSNGRVINRDKYFQPSITWSFVSSSHFGVRISLPGFIFDVGGSSAFPPVHLREFVAGMLCSNAAFYFMRALNPTLNFQVGNIAQLPLPFEDKAFVEKVSSGVRQLFELAKSDWDSSELSWDFAFDELLGSRNDSKRISTSAAQLAETRRRRVKLMKSLEEENNRLFLEKFSLDSDLSPVTDSQRVSLFCNPSYRYGAGKSETELEALLLADTMREFTSYAVGCMLGRYSLDKPGLILANQGETAEDYRQQIPEPTFAPDEDNVIPLLDGDWFEDDITERFKAFLKVTFGTEHYNENFTFLENALYPENVTGKKRKTIRYYFLKDFYNHHIKLYKKRPIYWLFSSPKGTFNALIYMHRYRPDTVGTVLHYLREFRDKLIHHAEHQQMLADSASASKSEKTQAIKDVAAIKKQLKELEDYEKTLFEVAARKIDIDLDDGVKHNYQLFGSVLRKIPGLDAKGDE